MMPITEAVNPTLVREARHPTAPSMPGIHYGRPSILSTLAAIPRPFPASKVRFSSARDRMAPRRRN